MRLANFGNQLLKRLKKNHSFLKKKNLNAKIHYPTSSINCVPSNLGGKRERRKKLKG